MISLLACASLLGARQEIRWADQLNDPAWMTKTAYLRPATAIAGQPLIGPTLKFRGAAIPKWRLLNPPPGLVIDKWNRLVWPDPVEGRYLTGIVVQVGNETQSVDWQLNVIHSELSDAVIYSTKHMDFIVPQAYADWMQASGAGAVVDGYYEFARDLVGAYPASARQSIIYTPSIGGAHSGVPVVSGPFTFGDNDVNRWRLGFLFHELGHNFNAGTRVGLIEHGDGFTDTTLHDLVEFNKIAWVLRMLEAPGSQGVTDVPKFVEWMNFEQNEFLDSYRQYLDGLPKGGFLSASSQSGAWAGLIHQFAFDHGRRALDRTMLAIRRDGIPLSAYPPAPMSLSDRFTMLLCVMSNAVGGDLRKEFHAKGLPLDDKLYDRLNPAVAKAMAQLPSMSLRGASRCPVDGHYYCPTPYPTNWFYAEQIARRMGGHLATIRSPEQEKWLGTKFALEGWLWLGYRRIGDSWKWMSGETPPAPIWEPGRPEANRDMDCGVLIQHEEQERSPWFGISNRPAGEHHNGLIEFDRPPKLDADSLP